MTKNVVARKVATEAGRNRTGDVISPKPLKASWTAEAKKKK